MPPIPDLAQVSAPTQPVVRVARRGYDPFAPVSWDYANNDGTFGNRFDDPGKQPDPIGQRGIFGQEERFRVIYCASDPVGAFGETLARVRPALGHAFIDPNYVDDEDEPEPVDLHLRDVRDPDDPRRGLVSAEWRSRRVVCTADIDPTLTFVDLMAPNTINHLRLALAPLARYLGLPDIDFSTVVGPMREFTQEASRYIFEQHDASGNPLFAGIRYSSRHTPTWECWAIFADRIQGHLRPGFPESILPDNAALLEIARLFNLTVESVAGTYIRP